MKNIVIASVVLASLGLAVPSAFADSKDGPGGFGSSVAHEVKETRNAIPYATHLLGQNDEWLSGYYGMTKDADELRRWDEKNHN